MRKVLFIFMLTGLLSCTDGDKDIAIDMGEDFFPVQLGMKHTYWVNEITFDAQGSDTSQYYLQEEVVDTILSPEGITKYLINRSKSDDTTNWQLDSVWTVHRQDDFMVVTENNLPIVKMAFPVQEGRIWNGNAFNTRSEVAFYYEPVSVLTQGGLNTTGNIRVILEDIPQNLVNQDERSEVYSRGIGLIEKDYITLNFCTINCVELGEIESGRILTQYLISYEL